MEHGDEDSLTMAVAAAITREITPKHAYNGEIDKDKWVNWRIP